MNNTQKTQNFNLSEKIDIDDIEREVITLEDVKEFIRLLKEEFKKKYIGLELFKNLGIIDALAGEKLK